MGPVVLVGVGEPRHGHLLREVSCQRKLRCSTCIFYKKLGIRQGKSQLAVQLSTSGSLLGLVTGCQCWRNEGPLLSWDTAPWTYLEGEQLP